MMGTLETNLAGDDLLADIAECRAVKAGSMWGSTDTHMQGGKGGNKCFSHE